MHFAKASLFCKLTANSNENFCVSKKLFMSEASMATTCGHKLNIFQFKSIFVDSSYSYNYSHRQL